MKFALTLGLTLLSMTLLSSARPAPVEAQPSSVGKVVTAKQLKELPSQVKEIANKDFPEPTVSAPVAVSGDIQGIIVAAANKYGIDPQRALRIAKCESGFNPNAVNLGYAENGNPSGLFQHLSGYWPARAAKYGYAGASVFDPVANANVTMGMWRDGGAGAWECR
jgi:hypothetical protein